MKHWIRIQTEKLLQHYGYELKIAHDPVRGFGASLAFARSRGLNPKTVFDVGVGHGTRWLYEAFPTRSSFSSNRWTSSSRIWSPSNAKSAPTYTGLRWPIGGGAPPFVSIHTSRR